MAGASEPLAVWLYGEHVATLERRRGRLRLTHSDAAQRRFGLNVPLVSMSMPVSARPYGHELASAFFEGLLPEGEVRRAVAYDLGLPESDVFGLLGELGRDCAGALVVQPVSAGNPVAAPLAEAEPVDGEEVARRMARLRVAPLGIDDRVRLSLAGVQGKLLLVRRPDGGWALPTGGVPSTHILKPATALPQVVENEAFCLRAAGHAGLAAAEVEIASVGGRPVLVVTRFDRARPDSGEVVRLHQEDACQALGIAPARKYEEHDGPSLVAMASTLRRWRAPEEELDRLLEAVTFSVAVGNADLHGKNVTFLHDGESEIRLAPLYDVMCTRAYPDVSAVAGMFVNGVTGLDDIGPGDLVAEAEAWGLPARRAAGVVDRLLERLPGALEAAASETGEVPEALVGLVSERVARARAASARTSGAVAPAFVPSVDAPAVQEAAEVRVDSAEAGEPRVWVTPYRRADGTPVAGHWRARRALDSDAP
ncbi:MAG TPA: type II toxin-antitoxin system HipA family toxin [Acidimicrobiaceae bacterium]|nr:type II toxin-antitoxin system HipA family toxin [Acidimicrobiaceae bacterium]